MEHSKGTTGCKAIKYLKCFLCHLTLCDRNARIQEKESNTTIITTVIFIHDFFFFFFLMNTFVIKLTTFVLV